MQAENLNPELIHVFLLPWQPYDGWQACIEGVFIGPGKMNINFEIGDGNSPMIVAFRYLTVCVATYPSLEAFFILGIKSY